MAFSQTPKTFFGLAALFLVLGIGNISFSSHKIEYYQKLLAEAQTKKAESVGRSPVPSASVSPGESNFDSNVSDQEYLKKLHSRLDYYRLANHGGSLFLAISTAMLLLGLLYSQSPGSETES